MCQGGAIFKAFFLFKLLFLHRTYYFSNVVRRRRYFDTVPTRWLFDKMAILPHSRSDSQTTGLILTTGVLWRCTKRTGANNMNIHYDVTGLLSAVGKVCQGGGGSYTHSTCVISRSLSVEDNWID